MSMYFSKKNYINSLVSACRTKHLNYQTNLFTKLKFLLKNFFNYNISASDKNKTTYFLPNNKLIPREFIRLEPWELEYLFSVAQFCKKGIVEIGRFNGGSTVLFGVSNTEVQIWSIDIAPQDDARLIKILKNFNIKNVNLITGDSQKTTYDEIKTFDLLFIDGDHSYKGCFDDLNNWWSKLSVGGHLILHDCYLFSEVQDAVIDFLKNKNVEIVISAYRGSEHWLNRYSGSLCHYIKKN